MFDAAFPGPAPRPRRPVWHPAISLLTLVAFLALLGSALAGCAGAPMGADSTAAGPTAGTGAASATADTATASGSGASMGEGMAMGPAETAAWAARPDFVSGASTDTQIAYAYALSHQGSLRYIPCYCGCSGSGHRSNLDCYLKPRQDGAPIVFEQHASFCDVCVRITELAKQLSAQGQSLRLVRQAVDAQFSGASAPGTATELPPA
ncbi:MAG TPA: PCYCGC motif-containing (lipo)protein [Candidatus Limnocylindrales bacterium]